MPKYLNGVPYYTKTEAINAMSRAGPEYRRSFKEALEKKQYPLPVVTDAGGDVLIRKELLHDYIKRLIAHKKQTTDTSVPGLVIDRNSAKFERSPAAETILRHIGSELDSKDPLWSRAAVPYEVNKELPSATPTETPSAPPEKKEEKILDALPVTKGEHYNEGLFDKFIRMGWGRSSYGIADFLTGMLMESRSIKDLVKRGREKYEVESAVVDPNYTEEKAKILRIESGEEQSAKIPNAESVPPPVQISDDASKVLDAKLEPLDFPTTAQPQNEAKAEDPSVSTGKLAEVLKELVDAKKPPTNPSVKDLFPTLNLATGGMVDSHPGKPQGTDTVPAWLTPNEYVINPVSAQYNKALLDKINNTQGPVYFASGGQAPSPGEQKVSQLKETFNISQLFARASAGDPTAIKGLMEKVTEKISDKIERMIDVPFDFLSGKRQKAGDMLAGIGEFEPSGIIKSLGESVELLRKWNENLLKANFQFAEFSASMALTKAYKEMLDIQLSYTRGERRGPFAMEHMKSSFELEKRLSKYEDTGANAMASLLTSFNNFANFIIPKVEGGFAVIGKMFPSLEKAIEKYMNSNKDDVTLWGNGEILDWNAQAGNGTGGLPRRFMNGNSFGDNP